MAHWVIEHRSTEHPEWHFVGTEMTEKDAERVCKFAMSTNYGKVIGYEVRFREVDNTIKFVCVLITKDDEVEAVVGPFGNRADAEHYGDCNAVSVNHYLVRMLVAPVVG